MTKPTLTYVERLLQAHRKKPTPTVYDRKQITLDDYLKRQSFEKLDEVIAAKVASNNGGA